MPYPHKMPEFVEFLTNSVPRLYPQEIPTADLCDAPLVCVSINEQWASHVMGAIDVLKWRDAWLGSSEEKQAAIDNIERIIEMFTYSCDDGRLSLIRNQNIIIYQQNLENIYEGDIHNVDPDAPNTDFDADSGDSGGDAARRDLVLCHAVSALVDVFCAEVLAGYGDEAAAAAIMSGVLGFLGPAGVAVGLAIGALILVVSGLEKAAFQDPVARQNVACCMYDALKGQANTQANLFAAGEGCYTTGSSYENDITTAMRTAGWNTAGNWLAFNKTLGELMRFANLDLLENCACELCELRLSGDGNADITSLSLGGAPAATYDSGSQTYVGGFAPIGGGPNGGRLFDLRLAIDPARTVFKVRMVTSAHRTLAGSANLQVIAWGGVDRVSTPIVVTGSPVVLETVIEDIFTGVSEIRFYGGANVTNSANGGISVDVLEVCYI